VTTSPEQLLADLVAHGARVVSLNPVRETLEDFFVQSVRNNERDRFVARKTS
jgi:hypothetical protein